MELPGIMHVKKEFPEPNDSFLQSNNKNVDSQEADIMDMDIFIKEESIEGELINRTSEYKQTQDKSMKSSIHDAKYVNSYVDENNPPQDPLADPLMQSPVVPLYCSICSEPHTSMENLESHLETHFHNVFQCNVCGRKLLNKRTLASHMKLHLERLISCSECDKKFHHKKDLNRHSRVHTGEKPFQCGICQKYFHDKSTLNCHIRVHTGEKPFQCEVCLKAFSQKASLRSHNRLHTDDKPYECSICTKKFHDITTLKRHSRAHTGEKPFQCAVCIKYFYDKSTLNCHVRVHTGIKPFQCHICCKNFSQKVSLRSHLRLHNEEKPYECPVCKKNFHDGPTLKRHSRVHTGEKPYQCFICYKRFTQKVNLRNHLPLHPESQLIQCEVCNKNFIDKEALVCHLDTHMEEKPLQNVCSEIPNNVSVTGMDQKKKIYNCEVCREVFAGYFPYMWHMTMHAGERLRFPNNFYAETPSVKTFSRNKQDFIPELYQCDICKENFTDKTTLICHFRKHTVEPEIKNYIGCNNSAVQKKVGYNSAANQDVLFQCDVCSETFSNNVTLRIHILSHVSEVQLRNDPCVRSCEGLQLTDNSKEISEDQLFPCDTDKSPGTCNFPINNLSPISDSLIQSQQNSDHEVTGYISMDNDSYQRNRNNTCKNNFTENVGLQSYRMQHTAETKKKSDSYRRNSYEKISVDVVSKTNCQEELHEHDIKIENYIPEKVILGNSAKASSQEQHHQCDIGMDVFPKKSILLVDSNSRTVETQLSSDISVSSSSTIDGSLKDPLIPPPNKELYQDAVCSNNKHTQENQLPIDSISSIKMESEEKSFKCIYCTECFHEESSLSCHVKLHTANTSNQSNAVGANCNDLGVGNELLSFKCEVCMKCFNNNSRLKSHMKVHNKKILNCDVCGESFRFKCNYNNHYKLHSGGKSFQCFICHKTFIRLAYLGKHLKRHNEEMASISVAENVPNDVNTREVLNLDVHHSVFE